MEGLEKKLSIPYNNDIRGITALFKKYDKYIGEVYFPINPEVVGSGRGGEAHAYYDDFVKALISHSKKHHIKTNMIINPLGSVDIFSNEMLLKKILNYIDLFSNVFEIDYVTVTSPILAKRISQVTRVAKVVASVNMFIASVEGAKKAKQIGIKEFYLDRDSNYNIELIKRIKENVSNMKVRVILNEGCLSNCLFRVSHFECLAKMRGRDEHKSIKDYEEEHRNLGCYASFKRDLTSFVKSPVIRPENIKEYLPFVDMFKIVGRTTPTYMNELRLKGYINGSFDGDFVELMDNPVAKRVLDEKQLILSNALFPDDYFERKASCDSACLRCNYCEKVVKRVGKNVTETSI